MKAVEVKCRKCGRMAEADKFVLDHTFKMMVCPACVREIKTRQMKADISAQKAEEKKPEPSREERQAEREDKELEKAYQQKTAGTVQVEKVDSEKVKYRCPGCNYEFVYNTTKMTPGRCPYCGAGIAKFASR